ncbi:AAA family ATPase [Streptomyces sp. NPDC088400]|uniref:AAA family ATPase n=1 Tax=Streptomyces sp. NPDC088400 TaxID=3365861 RepID=UPI003817295E
MKYVKGAERPEKAPEVPESTDPGNGALADPDGLLAAALALAAEGVKVFPCHRVTEDGCTCGNYACKSPGKHPRNDHGSKDATTEPETIRMWWIKWGQHGRLNLGQTLTGRAVVDVDVAEGKPGEATWEALSAAQDVPKTLTYRTGRAGLQMVFQLPDGETGGKADGYSNTLGAAVDFKTGPGAYVMVPGSKTDDVYTVVHGAEPAPLPGWVAELARTAVPGTGGSVVAGRLEGSHLSDLLSLAADDPARGNNWLAAVAGHYAADTWKFAPPRGWSWYSDMARAANSASADPIGEADLLKTMRSIWDTEARQHEQAEAEAVENQAAALLDEMLTLDDLAAIPPARPVLKGYLYRGTVARMYGASGSMKSFLALDVAIHVANGWDWYGHRVEAGPVVYIVAEGAAGVWKRGAAWQQHHGKKIGPNLKFLPRPVQVTGPEWDALVAACERLRPVLVVLDTQARVTVGVDENSNTDMGEVVALVDRLKATTGACVWLVHHTGHNADRSRGASAVKGAMDTELSVKRDGKDLDETTVTLGVEKQKDAEELPDKVFQPRQVVLDGLADEDGDPVTSVVLVPLKHAPRDPDKTALLKAAILAHLRQSDPEPVSQARFRSGPYKPEKTHNTAVSAAFGELKDAGRIVQLGVKGYVLGDAEKAAGPVQTILK